MINQYYIAGGRGIRMINQYYIVGGRGIRMINQYYIVGGRGIRMINQYYIVGGRGFRHDDSQYFESEEIRLGGRILLSSTLALHCHGGLDPPPSSCSTSR